MSTTRRISMGRGEDEGGVSLAGDLGHGRQDPQVHGGGVALDPFRGVRQGLGSLELALGVDDLGAPVTLRLSLTRHGATHGLGQLDVLDLDEGDLDTPRIGDVVDDALKPLVDLVPVDQQFVQVDLDEDAAQLGLTAPRVYASDLLVFQVLGRDRAAITDLVATVLGGLEEARGGPRALLETLDAYFASGCLNTTTARRLGVSVRTVTYRLTRIRQLTGHDPTDPDQRYILQTAALGARLLDWPSRPLQPSE
jgi:hypothetical protein